MQRLERLIDALNAELYNPVGLNILLPRKVAFLFVRVAHRVMERLTAKFAHLARD
jgi:hypothetical protein